MRFPESWAIYEVRQVILAERAFSQANRGFYGDIGCLSRPGGCIEGYKGAGFLDRKITSLKPWCGYERSFFRGEAVPEGEIRATRASSSSLREFAYVAVPIVPGRTGVRGFCGDSNGVICFTRDGKPPALEGGHCGPSCEPLR